MTIKRRTAEFRRMQHAQHRAVDQIGHSAIDRDFHHGDQLRDDADELGVVQLDGAGPVHKSSWSLISTYHEHMQEAFARNFRCAAASAADSCRSGANKGLACGARWGWLRWPPAPSSLPPCSDGQARKDALLRCAPALRVTRPCARRHSGGVGTANVTRSSMACGASNSEHSQEKVSTSRHSSLPESCAPGFGGVNDARRRDLRHAMNGAHPKGLSLMPSKPGATLKKAMGDRGCARPGGANSTLSSRASTNRASARSREPDRLSPMPVTPRSPCRIRRACRAVWPPSPRRAFR